MIGVRPRYPLLEGHAQTYEWFCAQGWQDLGASLTDPMWKASWDFAAEERSPSGCAGRS